jgi:hypothetical protein
MFSVVSTPRLYNKDPRPAELIIERVQLRDIHWKGRISAREVEESLLLEAVSRERLLKTLQAGDDLVICKVWRLAVAL